MDIKNPPTVCQEISINRKCLKSFNPYKLDSIKANVTLNSYSVFPGYGHRLPEGVFVNKGE